MVWLLTHFLFGVALALALAALLSLSAKRAHLLCVALGVWAILPDLQHVYDPAWLAFHKDHAGFNVFVFHYSLDQPWAQERQVPILLHAIALTILMGVCYALRRD